MRGARWLELAAAVLAGLLAGCDSGPTEPRGAAVFLAVAEPCRSQGTAELFRFMTDDPAVIADATARLGTAAEIWVTGRLRTGDGGFNAPWRWHHDPATVHLAEVTAEGCQACPSMVEDDLDYWTRFGQYCAPGRIAARER